MGQGGQESAWSSLKPGDIQEEMSSRRQLVGLKLHQKSPLALMLMCSLIYRM